MAPLIKYPLFLLTLLFSANIFAADYSVNINPDKSPVQFLATGRPSAIKITGENAKASGALIFSKGGLNGSIVVDLDSFQTGISLRDKHMKEKYLETGKPGFSKSELKLVNVKLPAEFFQKSVEVKDEKFKGVLKLHGLEKEIEGVFSAGSNPAANEMAGTASFKAKITDFGIDVPKFSGITVAEDVSIQVRFTGQVKKVSAK